MQPECDLVHDGAQPVNEPSSSPSAPAQSIRGVAWTCALSLVALAVVYKNFPIHTMTGWTSLRLIGGMQCMECVVASGAVSSQGVAASQEAVASPEPVAGAAADQGSSREDTQFAPEPQHLPFVAGSGLGRSGFVAVLEPGAALFASSNPPW